MLKRACAEGSRGKLPPRLERLDPKRFQFSFSECSANVSEFYSKEAKEATKEKEDTSRGKDLLKALALPNEVS